MEWWHLPATLFGLVWIVVITLAIGIKLEISRARAISKPTYWQRLKHHPGFVPAACGTMGGAIAAGWYGALIMSVLWVPVLLTARNQPVPSQSQGGER